MQYEHWTQNYPPRDEDRVQCSVCGFLGVDANKDRQPEVTPTTYATTGTTYDAPDVADIDLEVTPTVPSHGGCPLCGTGRWSSGSRGDL